MEFDDDLGERSQISNKQRWKNIPLTALDVDIKNKVITILVPVRSQGIPKTDKHLSRCRTESGTPEHRCANN
jgi:hypothetical protein